jgi:hypothetical protein
MTKHPSMLEKLGLVESDEPELPHDLPHAPPPAQPLMQPNTMVPPPAAVTGAQPPPQFTSSAPLYTAPAVLTEADQKQLQAMTTQVYAMPSTYVIFQRVRESLGNISDVNMIFKVLSAANPGVTTDKVVADIETHLGIVGTLRARFDQQMKDARAAKIDGPTQGIADLTAANAAAVQQIADRTAKIAQMQTDIANADRALQDAAVHFKLVEDQLNAPLLQTKQLLSTAH